MKKFLLLSLISFQFLSYGQDLDIYNIKQDDKLKIPNLPYGMTADEFQLLSRSFRMKDMLYAMVVPGYAHFHAKEMKTGYWLLGTRVSGFMGLAWIGLVVFECVNFYGLILNLIPILKRDVLKLMEW